ncbi:MULTISPECIES: DUF2726 domain-containing protein [Enterobacter]|uniref:DUF2726 domain-containing protein n=1 Tax=Enterobacter TaxID=547 RepID=UPI001F512D91|nr:MULTISPECIES: DUF2726 domain-containing protein [Enterobacter]MDS1915932.1 DUF2726 domain-containing protein [Enterobacter asburiae]MDX7664931.1 DUF2726 domain-containing protein [Enterobacter asburiae]
MSPRVVATSSRKIQKLSLGEEKEDLFWGMVVEGVILENKKYMTTLTERQYLEKLEAWFGQYCRIFCQMSPGRFLKLPEQEAFSAEERARFFTQFNAMSVDYVLVSRKNNKIVCVIELDDKSHELDERIARDIRLEHMFEMAGVPLLRVNVDEMNTQSPVWERRKAVEERMAVS